MARTMAKSKLKERIPKITDRILFQRRFHSRIFAQPSPFFGWSNFKDFVANFPLDNISERDAHWHRLIRFTRITNKIFLTIIIPMTEFSASFCTFRP